MKLVAEFNFEKAPATLGMAVRVGDNQFFTLNGKALEYHCEPNELLVITSLKHVDKLGMLQEVSLVIDGVSGCGVGYVVQPGERLGVLLRIKRAEDFRLPPAQIDYPVTVNIEVKQYQVTNISP